jgi:predicted phosphoribosyltransferase
MEQLFEDRTEAGRVLAGLLTGYANRPDVLVLALPRGGVPVAAEVARVLHVPMDVVVVRKLGVPGHEELAMGAIASGGARVTNHEVVQGLRIPPSVLEAAAATQLGELERRERLYRGDRPFPDVRGQIVILVDDGLATGSTMRAAIAALREQGPARIVVAVPTAPRLTCAEMRVEADACICASIPDWFYAVGQSYVDFPQVGDEEVRLILAQTARNPVATG